MYCVLQMLNTIGLCVGRDLHRIYTRITLVIDLSKLHNFVITGVLSSYTIDCILI
jgi:hypothetical protein